MAKFILKDWYGKNCEFDHDKIFVQDANGNLVQFSQGDGAVLEELYAEENGTYTPNEGVDGFSSVTVDIPEQVAVLQNKTITEDGTYTADDGYDGLGTVTVKVDDVNELLLSNFEVTGFAEDATLGGYSKELTFGTDLDAFGVIEDREYTVGWDDGLYTVHAKDTRQIIEEPDGEGGTIYRMLYYLGNGTLLGIDGLEGNDEPFAILWTQGIGLKIVTTDTAESHVLGLVKRVRPRDGLDMLLESKTITENGTYTPDEIYDGFSSITVEVAGAGASDDVRYVTFMSYDGTIEYGKKAVAVGDDCADPIARGIFDTPTRESDAQYNYTHNGWATEVNGVADSSWNKAITEDKTVYASFASAVRYYTITYYDSDGTTVLKTESLAYGATPSYSPTKENYVFGGWTPDVTSVTGDASYTVVWEEKVTFATASWEKIISIAENGQASEMFAVGDTKEITITYEDGTTEENALIIADFNKLKLSDGTTASMVLVPAYALENKKPMYDSYSKSGTFLGSTLDTWLNSTLINALPTELQAGLKEGIASMTMLPKYRKCSLLSLEELQLSKTNFSEYGSVSLSLFSSNAKRIRKQGKNGSAVQYLTRAFYSSSTGTQCALVDTTGASYGGTTVNGYGSNTTSYGIVFRLCI